MTLPIRKNLRLKDYDYTNSGAYFVTICTHHKQALFGQIKAGVVELNSYGQHAERDMAGDTIAFPCGSFG